MQAMQQFEESFKTKLNAVMSEVREALGRVNLAFFNGDLEFHELIVIYFPVFSGATHFPTSGLDASRNCIENV